MNCKDKTIKLEALSNGDDLDLLKKTLGVYETLPEKVKDLASSVACECSGLPLAIVTVARSMKGKQDLREWDMDKWVFPVLRSSYDHLSDTKLQEFFLYCAVLRCDDKLLVMHPLVRIMAILSS
ncbi:putative disease resistance protein [Senna tora]|uniref:Putative disease resistance protein n=1 Tax=Senna tora TaxID=362788 RepID=A0A834X161_9FABA|nr:putative disease resistance protein [Senna tora]